MKKSIILIAIAGFFFGSCSKDFLEIESNRFISKDKIDEISKESPHLQIATLNGLYATMVKVGSGGTTSHDDFGQKGIDIYLDMLSSDMVLNGTSYGSYIGLSNLTSTVDYTSTDNYKPWRFYYYLIRGANNVIEGLGGNDFVPKEKVTKYSMGQAKAIRAYAYFYLTQLYYTSYESNEKLTPIYLEPILTNNKASNIQEVFDLVIKDLKEAIDLLEGFSKNKSVINKQVAQGILAYALAAKGTPDALTEVKSLTESVINSGLYTISDSTTLVGGFNNLNTKSWMWGADITIENNLNLISWWGQIDRFTYSYAWAGDPKGMDSRLYAAIKDNDIRKKQFNPAGKTIWPTNKFYAPERKMGGQREIETDYIYMRLDEMYLLNAEASAKLGQDNDAISRLKELLKDRIKDLSYLDALSGQELKDEIYLQTRIELWGEGKSYLAMKRNKATITRGDNHLSLEGKSFSYDDDKLTFEVPQTELLNNPNFRK